MGTTSSFTWKTEMRATSASSAGGEEGVALQLARKADRLHGQAAAQRLADGRWQLTVMADSGTFATDAVVSADDMRALAHAILDVDRHPMEAPALARVEIIDVAEHARTLYGQEGADRIAAISGRPTPEHDYRFRDNCRPGEGRGDATYGDGYTATHVMVSILRDRDLKAKGL